MNVIKTVHVSFESVLFQQNVPVGLNLLFPSEKVNLLINLSILYGFLFNVKRYTHLYYIMV